MRTTGSGVEGTVPGTPTKTYRVGELRHPAWVRTEEELHPSFFIWAFGSIRYVWNIDGLHCCIHMVLDSRTLNRSYETGLKVDPLAQSRITPDPINRKENTHTHTQP